MITVNYVTSNPVKELEISVFFESACLPDGRPVSDVFRYRVVKTSIQEILEVDLEALVRAEVISAYQKIRVPCIVEHAGLVLEQDGVYPGGLTKPMWNALSARFSESLLVSGRDVVAVAVVGYCDGKQVRLFRGETKGSLVAAPQGDADFYWDNVFVPTSAEHNPSGLTYAEIVARTDLGRRHKVIHLSQSGRALSQFLAYRIAHAPSLWS